MFLEILKKTNKEWKFWERTIEFQSVIEKISLDKTKNTVQMWIL